MWISLLIFIAMSGFVVAAYYYGINIAEAESLERGKRSRDADVAGLERKLRILATHPGTTQANVIQNAYNAKLP